MIIDDYIALFLDNRPVNTARAYQNHLHDFIGWMHDNRHDPMKPTKVSILQYCNSLSTLKPATQHAYLAAVRSFYKFMYDLDVIKIPVFEIAKKQIRVSNDPTKRYLTTAEINLLFSGAADIFDRCILTWLYYGGLRVAELCNLMSEDIHDEPNRFWATVMGKGSKPRTIDLPRICCDLARAVGWPDGTYLLTSQRMPGRPINPSTIFRHVRACAERAGLQQPISPHWLRHAHVSHALDAGASPQTVQRTVGHTSLATTTRYAHPRPGDSSSYYLTGGPPHATPQTSRRRIPTPIGYPPGVDPHTALPRLPATDPRRPIGPVRGGDQGRD